jgi:hypothetical protein
MKRYAILLAVFICSSSAAMADGASSTFELPGATFNVPLPAGYCVATGDFDGIAKVMAAADTTNLTDTTYVACDANGTERMSSWGMIKTPLSTLRGEAGPRSAMIAELKAYVNSEEGKKVIDAASASAAEKSNLNTIFGAEFKGAAKFDALDSDGNGVYFGGVANYDNGHGKTFKVAAAYSVTVANNRVFSVYLFEPFNDVSDIGALLIKVKQATAAFVAANGG